MPAPAPRRADSVAAVVMAAALLLVGCAGIPADPVPPSSSATGDPATSDPTAPEPALTLGPGEEVLPTSAPQLHPDGTAEQNEQYFRATIEAYRKRHGTGDNDRLVAWLVAAGYQRSQMEMTAWNTPVGFVATSIVVSVRYGDECLIGSIRESRTATSVEPVTSAGTCLLGDLSDAPDR